MHWHKKITQDERVITLPRSPLVSFPKTYDGFLMKLDMGVYQ
jgi:hypothetical protein